MNCNLMLSVLLFSLATIMPAYARIPVPPTQENACNYLSQQMATSLYGAPVSPAKSQAGAVGAMSMCVYVDPKASDAVSLMIMTIPAGMEVSMMDAITKGSPTTHVTPVAGLGDHAVFASDTKALSLAVQSHGKMVVLGITGPDTPSRRSALIPVVRQMIGRL